MQIADFANFIREIPYEYQSFNIKRSIWGNEVNQKMIIDDIFSGIETISISRFDLFQSAWHLQEFALKVLMWGYPTKGRGKNIENLLKHENFEKLIRQLKMLEGKNDLTLAGIQEFQEIKGLGMSTITKFLYFKKVRIEKYPALIFDQKVLNALNNGRYRDFGIEKFKDIKSNNSVFDYMDYLSFMQSLAARMNVAPDQLELFLFEFGSNFKEPKGEEGDLDLM